MAATAARAAMERAGVHAGELDAIVLGTATPDRLLPSTAVDLQAELGAARAAAFDISAACSGWLYGMTVAEGLIATGVAETVLVVGAEKMSAHRRLEGPLHLRAVRRRRRRGGAEALEAPAPAASSRAYMRSDGTLADLLWRPSGGATMPVHARRCSPTARTTSRWPGREVFKHAVRSMAEACDRALDGAKLTGADIDLLIPHQANMRIIEATAKHANIPMDKVYVNVDRYGNTSSASIPIALDEAIESGRVKEGTTVLLVAFGAGFTWGSMVVRF